MVALATVAAAAAATATAGVPDRTYTVRAGDVVRVAGTSVECTPLLARRGRLDRGMLCYHHGKTGGQLIVATGEHSVDVIKDGRLVYSTRTP